MSKRLPRTRHRNGPWLWGFSVLFAILQMLSPGRAVAQLVINEVLSAPAIDWNGDGAVDFKNDEWVEILNRGSSPVDLSGVFLRDGTGDTYHYGFEGTLGPGEVRVVYGHQAVQWQVANGAGTSGLSLNNSGDTVELWRDIAEPRVLEPLDSVIVPAHAAGTDRSLGRDPETSLWVLYDALNLYGGELEPLPTGCEPSPGQSNICEGSVPLGLSSWGDLKVEYTPRH
jgi:hypothetical protein